MGGTSGGGAMCRFYVAVSKNKVKKNQHPPAALVRSLHCVCGASSPLPATAACACTFTFSHCVCVLCVCVCLHIRAPPADSPLSARHGNRFTLPSSPVDVEVCAKITIDIAMVTVTRVALCLSACVHVRGGHHVSCGGWLCFSRGIAGVTLAGRRGLQLQPLVNNVAPLLAAAAGGEKERKKKSLDISEWLPWQQGAESGPNFVSDSRRRTSRCRGRLFTRITAAG